MKFKAVVLPLKLLIKSVFNPNIKQDLEKIPFKDATRK